MSEQDTAFPKMSAFWTFEKIQSGTDKVNAVNVRLDTPPYGGYADMMSACRVVGGDFE